MEEDLISFIKGEFFQPLARKKITDNYYRYHEILTAVNICAAMDGGNPVGPSSSVLDAGSNIGLLMRVFRGNGYNDVSGIEIDPAKIQSSFEVIRSRITEGSILDNGLLTGHSFNLTTCNHVLEHLHDNEVDTAISNLVRWTRDWLYIEIATDDNRDWKNHFCIHDGEWWKTKIIDSLRKSGDMCLRWEKFEKEWPVVRFLVGKKQSFLQERAEGGDLVIEYSGFLASLSGKIRIKFGHVPPGSLNWQDMGEAEAVVEQGKAVFRLLLKKGFDLAYVFCYTVNSFERRYSGKELYDDNNFLGWRFLNAL